MTDQPLPLPEFAALDAEYQRQLRLRREEMWRAGASTHPKECASCGARIRWCLSSSVPPRWLPLDAAPDPAGDIAVHRHGAAPIGWVNPPPETPGKRWRSHFATCPDADQHRRRRP